MFLYTLGLATDKMVQTALSKTTDTRLTDISDQRGKHIPSTKLDEDTVKAVIDHINKFNRSISHYRRMHAPNRLYISPEFNVTYVHNDFCESNPDKKKFRMHIITVKSKV